MYRRLLVPLEHSAYDDAILEHVRELDGEGFPVDAILGGGDPSEEITAAAEREGCDLIAMSTHGHRFIKHLLYGSVAEEVRHRSTIPVLLVRGSPARRAGAQGQPA